MDLRFLDARPTDDERDAVDALLGPAPSVWTGGHRRLADTRSATGGASEERRHLLPALHALNDSVGWISQGGLNYVCQRLQVAPAEAYGVATFYDLFAVEARPARVVHVCQDLACLLAGAPEPTGSSADVSVVASPCLGLCERAPAALVLQAGDTAAAHVLAPASVATVAGAAMGLEPGADAEGIARSVPQAGDPSLVLLARVGSVDPTSLVAYQGAGGYRALERALALGPDGVVAELHAARLVGRGGAAFPAGRKWEAVARHGRRPHEVICNADESEPGTFKDRVLMEGDPYAVVEALTIAGVTVGAERGWIYLRGEYPLARARLQHAIEQCRAAGLLGADVLGRGVAFDIEIFRGAGAYICGEETAIFNSMEGERGEPRNKPPFPVDAGLFGRPTLVNNVETLVNVLPVLVGGGAAYAATGTEGSTGTKLFCVSGRVARPGVYEVPFGATLRDVLSLAGGVHVEDPLAKRPNPRHERPGRPDEGLQAVLLGGAAGSFVGPEHLDVALTFEGTRAIGASLGSGVVMVLDDTVDLVPLVLRIAAFFRHESCGQCVPCRVGTVRQQEALLRLAAANDGDTATDLALLQELALVMQDASICGLGQTAATAVLSAVRRGVFA